MNYLMMTTEELKEEVEYLNYILEQRETEENLEKRGYGVSITTEDGSISKVPLWQTTRETLIQIQRVNERIKKSKKGE